MKPTKTEMRRAVRANTWGRGYRYEVLVYRDLEDYKENMAHHGSLNDFTPLTEALKDDRLLQPGHVFDIYIYENNFGGRGRGLIANATIELQKEKGGPYFVSDSGWQQKTPER